jgi:hypothetical protein
MTTCATAVAPAAMDKSEKINTILIVLNLSYRKMDLLEAVRVIVGDIKSTKQHRIHAW